ncbi:MAG: YrdB family protein [Caldilineales bacterium]|nr:YrdB family protein [Caldilineales bacterium]
MANNPINLAVRFILEIAGLFALALWGWNQSDGWMRFVLGIGISLFAAVVWGVFNVPGDHSRSGSAPVPVPGIVRLGIELAFFIAATWALFDLGLTTWAWVFGGVLVIHYVVSYDRIRWLISQ